MKHISLLLFLFCLLSAYGQQLTYSLFDENQFKGLDIYDVIQDNEKNYILATDQGVLFHDGYSYQQISCKEMKGASVFGFTKDSKGVIYCFNLHHQIFRIAKGEISLFHQINEDLKHHNMWLSTDSQDNLLIQSSGLISISKDRTKNVVLSKKLFTDGAPINFHNLGNNKTICSSSSGEILQQENGQFTHITSKTVNDSLIENGQLIIYWLKLKNKTYIVEPNKHKVYEFNEDTKGFKYITTLANIHATNGLRIYQSKDKLWVSGGFNGVYLFDSNFKALNKGERLYSDYFISDVFEDYEGNTLLSTFDNGILLIKSDNVLRIKAEDEKITCLSSDNKNLLFLGTDRGKIYSYNNNGLQLLYEEQEQKGIEYIGFWENAQLLLYSYGKGVQISSWNKTKLNHIAQHGASIKHSFFTSKTSGLLAFNDGISIIQNEKNKIVIKPIKELTSRSYNVVVAPLTKTIYTGLSSGLMELKKDKSLKQFKYKGQAIYPNSLVVNKTEVYIGTQNYGVLVLHKDKVIRQIPFKDQIRKMEIHGSYLYILSNSKLYRSKLDYIKFETLNYAQGLNCERVSDFHILNDHLYLTDSKNIEYIALHNLNVKSEPLPILITGICVNDKINFEHQLASEQRKIEFNFSVSTIRYRNTVKYRFKLKGYDKNWSLNNYENNKVTYNALPPGDYTFMVQSINGQVESEIIRHSFSIDAPFYQKWWFYVLISVLSFSTIGFIFFLRIKNIRAKNKERLAKQKIQTGLLESELKALRSQMNPHFIFNALNSIQDLVLKEDTDASYDYIVLFAELVRNTLNYSNQSFIPIGKEIEFLNIYLRLEKLRFKDDLEYTIHMDESVDIKVPSMLVQPFIENALLHGLLHKQGRKSISIRFILDDKLTCIIEDNGVGRTKSKEIQERQSPGHESFALEAINKRLEILKSQNHAEVGYTIEDLYEDHKAIGTRVILTMPFHRIF